MYTFLSSVSTFAVLPEADTLLDNKKEDPDQSKTWTGSF